MSGYHGLAIVLPRCEHGLTPLDRCGACDEEREAVELAVRRSVADPAQVILDALDAQRPWFATCAFCSLGAPSRDALPLRRHELSCPFVTTIAVASTLYEQHIDAAPTKEPAR